MTPSLRQGYESENEAIGALSQADLEASRIAEMVGTTPATVSATMQKAAEQPGQNGSTAKGSD